MYEKQDALYTKYPLMINGITDRQGDVINSVTDVKKIFTNSNEILFDEEHDRIPIEGISIQESYISKYDEIISGTIVPSGSWIVIIRIDNPEIQNKILPPELGGTGEYQGLSLWNDIKESCKAGLIGQIRYTDLPSPDCALPKFISFVLKPANGVGLYVMDYDVYISKSDNMTKEMDANNKLAKIAELLGFKKQEIFVAKSESAEEVKEEKVEEVKEEKVEEVKEEKVEEVKEESKSCDAHVSKAEDMKQDPPAEQPSNPNIDDLIAKIDAQEERINKIEEAIKQASEAKPAEVSKSEDKEEKEPEKEEPKIVKSSKIVGKVEEKTTSPNYYEITNRDPVTGCKIRK